MLKRSLARMMSLVSLMGAFSGSFLPLNQKGKAVQRGNVAAKRLNQRRGKASGGRGRVPYHPGKLGVSAVSAAIHKRYGAILSRKERKRLAKESKQAFVAFYNRG